MAKETKLDTLHFMDLLGQVSSMDRLEKLEKAWLWYRAKQLFKSFVVVLFAAFIGATIAYMFWGKEIVGELQETKNITQDVPQERVKETPKLADSGFVITKNSSELMLNPSYEFEKSISARVQPARRAEAPVAVQQAQPEEKLVISRLSSLADLEDSFAKQPSYSKAIEIAKAYYAKNNYSNALKWALKANEIDSSDETSWEIFALSNEALGKKEQAIKALRVYLEARASQKLEKLLKQMEEQ